MPNSNTAALAAGPPWGLKIEGRALNSLGIAALAIAAALFMCASLAVVERTGVGLLVAALMIGGGELLCRQGGSRGVWTGNSLVLSGYALATFLAFATHYLEGVSRLGDPYLCWLLELVLGVALTIHGSRNQVLRWFSVPLTLTLTGDVLYRSFNANEIVSLFGFEAKVSAIASVVAMGWLAGLSALSKKLEQGIEPESLDFRKHYARVMYWLSHEVYFVAVAINALALPHFLDAIRFAPVFWAVETPVLLALSWRSSSFVKHALVMGIWGLSAVLVVLPGLEMHPILRMAVPVSGLAMAMCYRFIQSDWKQWQKVIGYGVYLWAGLITAAAVPLLTVGAQEALPFFLAQAGVMLVAALLLRDGVLQRLATVAGALALVLFGSTWQEWTWFPTVPVVIACYALSLTYSRIHKNGGWLQSDFIPFAGKYTIGPKEARWLEFATCIPGYVTLIVATIMLLGMPANTITIGVEALLLIGFGFASDKRWHRFTGVVAIFIACGKLWIFDLSGAGDGVRTMVGFLAFGVCSCSAGIFYLVEYVWLSNKASNAEGGQPPDDGNQEGDGN